MRPCHATCRPFQEAKKLASNPPPAYVTEINKFSNTFVSSATIALIRAALTPRTPPADDSTATPATENLPAWFRSEYKQKSTAQSFLGQVWGGPHAPGSATGVASVGRAATYRLSHRCGASRTIEAVSQVGGRAETSQAVRQDLQQGLQPVPVLRLKANPHFVAFLFFDPPTPPGGAQAGGLAFTTYLCISTPATLLPSLLPVVPCLQYVSDTFSLTGAAYLMEGVEQLARSLRQKDDAVNRMMGGVAAGGMLGYMCKCGGELRERGTRGYRILEEHDSLLRVCSRPRFSLLSCRAGLIHTLCAVHTHRVPSRPSRSHWTGRYVGGGGAGGCRGMAARGIDLVCSLSNKLEIYW